MNSAERFQRNISLISGIYPDYPSRIASAPDTHEYVFEKTGGGGVSCRIAGGPGGGGDRWLHGPGDPWAAARQTIEAADWRTASLFIVIRPGLGYVPFSLYPNLRKGRGAQRMLIVEDRIDLFRHSLGMFDWTDVLRSDRVIYLPAEDLVHSALDFFVTNPVNLLQPIAVILGANPGPEEARLMGEIQSQLQQMASTATNAAKGYLNDLETHYRLAPRDPEAGKSVVLVRPEHDYLGKPLSNGFEANGCRVNTFHGNQRLLNFLNPYLWLVYTREHFPDILVWMNRNTLSPEGAAHLAKLPIHKVLWFLDNPKRVETTREELEATDAVFAFDHTYLPYIKELGGKDARVLHTAAGLRPLAGRGPGDSWPEREGPDIGFVGALAANRFKEVGDFWRERDPAFLSVLDGIAEDHTADPSPGLEARYLNSPARDRHPYSGFAVLYLEERATYFHRLRTLQTVADLGLATHGAAEWGQSEWAGGMIGCYTGRAPQYGDELAGVYFHSRVNINLFHAQCHDCVTPRVYDVLAAGGFLLTEHSPAVEREFEPGRHLAVFQTPEELREKAEYYLARGDEREAIAREGQRLVLEKHTYAHRAKAMLDALGETGLS